MLKIFVKREICSFFFQLKLFDVVKSLSFNLNLVHFLLPGLYFCQAPGPGPGPGQGPRQFSSLKQTQN